jgi:hypothetical protein
MWDEEAQREVAGRQHGLIGRSQLLALGVSTGEIKRKLRTGRLQQCHAGVYYLDATPRTWKTEVLAAVMAAGPDALASHRSAGVLYGLEAVYGRVIEVTVPFNEEPEPKGVIVHRTRRPNPSAVLHGIPITPNEKTLLDLAPILGERNLYKATRSAIHLNFTTAEKLDLAIGLHGGRGVSGTRVARRVFHTVADDESGSGAEIDLAWIVMNAPIPKPIQQLKICLPDGANAYPDFSWPDRMRIVEVDGFGAHSTPEQMEHDLRRQNRVLDLGWEIRRFTPIRIRDEPQIVRAEIIRFVNNPFRAD